MTNDVLGITVPFPVAKRCVLGIVHAAAGLLKPDPGIGPQCVIGGVHGIAPANRR